MLKRGKHEEIVTGNGKSYRFAGSFAFAETLSLCGRDVVLIYSDLTLGILPPTDIKNAIKCAMMEVDGEAVKDADREALAIEFLEDFGLQECSALSRLLISHAIIGDIKKKRLGTKMEMVGMVEKLSLSRSMISKRAGWRWIAICLILALLACTIFSASRMAG